MNIIFKAMVNIEGLPLGQGSAAWGGGWTNLHFKEIILSTVLKGNKSVGQIRNPGSKIRREMNMF